MRRNLTLAVGLLLFAVAWFLPVHQHGKTLPQTLPGWEAFRVALFPDWEGNLAKRCAAALCVASALTNVLPVLLLLAWLRRNEPLIRLTGWACFVCLGLNAQWFLNDQSGLRIGYYFWWLSFGVLGVACSLCAKKPAPSSPF